MKISLNWIKDYVNLNDIDIKSLLNQFTLSVAEIEGVEYLGQNVSGVVTGKILQVNPHPNSKKLHLLKVDAGNGEVLDIVCGAPNVKEGLIVPLAKIGARVGDLQISKATVLGEVSYGMCCSEKELGISDNHAGLMELPLNTPLGVDIKELYQIEDVVFEVDNKSLTNRPDLWGHYGIAREIAALVNRQLQPLQLVNLNEFNSLPAVNIKVTSENCYRYSGITVNNITKNSALQNMKIRLYYAGMRSINLLTDLTNYLMLELGQPMHAFDNEKVSSIEVFNVGKETTFTTLDEVERTLPKNTMVISTNGNPVAIAGVMGGLNSGISDKTNSVLIESANFNALTIRKTSTALGLRSESSARYEKTLDPEITTVALARYLHLLKEADNNIVVTSSLTDVYNKKYNAVTINITKEYIDRYIGISISEETILNILRKLEFVVKVVDTGVYEILVPTFRATKDISQPCDIVEEITRIYGYDNITPKPSLQAVQPVNIVKSVDYEYRAKYLLATKFNFNEVHTYIWYDHHSNQQLGIEPKSVIKLVNALNKENSSIRATIVPSLLKVVLENKHSFADMNIFEVGRVASGILENGNVLEEKHLALLKYSKTQSEKELLLSIKNSVEYLIEQEFNAKLTVLPKQQTLNYYHPVNNYALMVNGVEVGEIATIHPTVKSNITKDCNIVIAELNFNKIVEQNHEQVKYEKVTKFPVSEFDFSFVTEKDMLYNNLSEIAHSLKSALNYSVHYVDTFANEDTKITTIKYKVWSLTHTLTNAEITEFYDSVLLNFKKHNISIKGKE